MTGQDTVDIPIYHSGGQAEANGAYGGSGVVSYTFEATDALQGVRKGSQGHDLLGGCVQVAGSGIVAQSLPEPQDFVLGGIGQVFYLGKPLHKALPIGFALDYSGLLENNFAEPDRIRIPGTAPGEVSPVLGVPVQDDAAEGIHRKRFRAS